MQIMGAGIGLVVGVLAWVTGFGLIFGGIMAGGGAGIALLLIGIFVIGAGTMAARKLAGR